MNIPDQYSETDLTHPKSPFRVLTSAGLASWALGITLGLLQQPLYAEPLNFVQQTTEPQTTEPQSSKSQTSKPQVFNEPLVFKPVASETPKTPSHLSDTTESDRTNTDVLGAATLYTTAVDTTVLDARQSHISSAQPTETAVSEGLVSEGAVSQEAIVQEIVAHEESSKERPLLNGRINELFIGPDGLSLDISVIGGCPGGTYTADLTVLTDSDLNRLLTTLLQAQSQQRVIRLFHHQALCGSKRFDRVSVTPY